MVVMRTKMLLVFAACWLLFIGCGTSGSSEATLLGFDDDQVLACPEGQPSVNGMQCGPTVDRGEAGTDGAAGRAMPPATSNPAPASQTMATADAGDDFMAGLACTAGGCGQDACLGWDGGYCSRSCTSDSDCNGAVCVSFDDLGYCLARCASDSDCRVNEGYVCLPTGGCAPAGFAPSSREQSQPSDPSDQGTVGNAPDTVPPEGPMNDEMPEDAPMAPPASDPPVPPANVLPLGSPCGDGVSCGAGMVCISNLPGGYCSKPCQSSDECLNGTCWDLGQDQKLCLASCGDSDDCRRAEGYICDDDRTCFPGEEPPPPCTPQSCPPGTYCAESGRCLIDVGEPPGGVVPACENVASWVCNGGNCGRLEQFLPIDGPGYTNYPLNGETANDQYRSYARRDLIQLIKYAAGMTDCLAAEWAFGNGAPLGLGDMSEANGAIPGTREGRPGHPPNTHTNGFDMDIAYYQINQPNNYLRAVCDHFSGGADQYHCVSQPEYLDVWRSALFIGYLHVTPQLRVIGVDGRIGELIDSAMDELCTAGYLTGTACQPRLRRLAFETTDMGQGWYRFHHHHLHISLSAPRNGSGDVRYGPEYECLRADCGALPHWSEDMRRLHDHRRHRAGDRHRHK
ncbi:MAG: hypothetical protein VX589_13700 [Myxococcota bacterium]|nr:hypothetical protein [Myxococcota bacterium]